MYIQAYVDLMLGDYEIDTEETEKLIESIKVSVSEMSVDEILSNLIYCVEEALSQQDIDYEGINENFIN